MKYENLIKYLNNEHGLILFKEEIQEIDKLIDNHLETINHVRCSLQLNYRFKKGDEVISTISREAMIIEELNNKVFVIQDKDNKKFAVKEETLELRQK